MDSSAHADSPLVRSSYVRVDSPYDVARWRPLAHWAMYIPHLVILHLLRIVCQAVFAVYWLVLLFTGKLNRTLYGVMVMQERYSTRANGFLLGWSEVYAPFDFDTGAADDGAYPPVRLVLPDPAEEVSRKRLLNILLAIPHYVVLAVYAIGALVVAVIAWFAVLFTGRWPAGMRDFLVQISNYYYRIWTYVTMVENDYPKFGLPAR